MTEPFAFAVTVVAAIAPFLLAVFIALRPTSRPKDDSDYFLYGRSLSASGFLSTSVGYSLQVAAVFLFFYWSTAYGAKAIFVPAAWFAGYLLVREALKRGALNAFLDSSTQTIHGFVGSQVNDRRRPLIAFMALSTIFGLGGTLVSELDYVSQFILSALAVRDPWFLVQVGILIFAGFYVLWGGYRAVVETDRYQVPLAYISFVLVLFIVLSEVLGAGLGYHSAFLAASGALLLGLFASLRARLPLTAGERTTTYIVFGPLILLLLAATIRGLVAGNSSTATTPDYWPATPHFLGFGILGVLSLGITNALWQFVDISSLQRLQSVRLSDDDARAAVLKGLTATAWEGSGVWVLAMLLALGLRLLGVTEGSPDAMGTFAWNSTAGGTWFLPLLSFALVTFMLSTIDGFISAMAFISYYDVSPQRAANHGTLDRARFTTLAALSLFYIGYRFLKGWVGDYIPAVLYAVYAVQLSIGFVILVALFWPRRLRPVAAFASIGSGWVAALYSAVASPPGFVVEDSWYVVPPLASLVTSVLVYLIVASVSDRARAKRG